MRHRYWSIGILILAAGRVAAHDDDVTLRQIQRQLARGDGPASVLLLRAEIHRADGKLAEAAADLDSAALLIPHSGALALCRAALASDQGRPDEALRILDACSDTSLVSDPRVPWMRGCALQHLGRMDEAAAVMDTALARHQDATAEHFLARSRVAERRPGEGVDGAIAVLEAGLEHWPGAWNIASRLVDLESATGRFDQALARLDAVISVAQRPERLLAQRGDVLARAGRTWEAREAWTQALAGLEARAATDPASRELATRLRTSLSEPPPTLGGKQP
jgi:predicted negative regulator of RcsB-dependent stress response